MTTALRITSALARSPRLTENEVFELFFFQSHQDCDLTQRDSRTVGTMKKIQTLLVDLDGTLVDSVEYQVQVKFIGSFLLYWRKRGFGWSGLKVLQCIKRALESPPSRLTNAQKVTQALETEFSIPEAEAHSALFDFSQGIFPSLEKHFYPVPGALEFIHWAFQHYPLILATNPVWSPEIVEMRVKWAGLSIDHFKSVTNIHRMSSCKPRKEYYQELLHQENLNPKNCLMIGNDLKQDGPAVKTGMKVFILSRENRCVRKGPLLWSGNFSALQRALQKGEFR